MIDLSDCGSWSNSDSPNSEPDSDLVYENDRLEMEMHESVLYTGSPRSKTVEKIISNLRDEMRNMRKEAQASERLRQEQSHKIWSLEGEVVGLEEENKKLVDKITELEASKNDK